MSHLHTLLLHGTQITDAGLDQVEKMTGLRHSDSRTPESLNVGMVRLSALSQLRLLNLENTQ